MIIMGVDPGTATTGFGVIEKLGSKYNLVDYGVILTPAKTELHYRLDTIFEELTTVLKKHQPDEVVVEELFFATNAKTAISVGQARGVILLAAKKQDIPIAEYTPLEVKMAITGYGKADKKQIQQMVKAILALKEIPKPDDAADALAIAICHAQTRKIDNLKSKVK